jgi:tripartite-type tricarboxylate transporter receptor subunit TctC
MASEEGRALLERMGAELFPNSPERTASFIQSELAKWSKIVKAAGIEPE